MNKTFKTILALAIGVVAMTFASCSSNEEISNAPSQQEIETKIIGKWKIIKMDGKDITTDDRSIHTYYSNGKGYISVSDQNSGISISSWMNKLDMTYFLNGNELVQTTGATFYSTINSISENNMSMMYNKIVEEGNVYTHNWPAEFSKVTADYSQDIIGMWEGVEMTGYETYGNAEARIEYRADGTYTYYVKDGENWIPSTNADNEYNVDGDWLAHRWRPEAGADYNYEWWDIDEIKDGTMKWSALREKEDGTRFTTTFTWKKVK